MESAHSGIVEVALGGGLGGLGGFGGLGGGGKGLGGGLSSTHWFATGWYPLMHVAMVHPLLYVATLDRPHAVHAGTSSAKPFSVCVQDPVSCVPATGQLVTQGVHEGPEKPALH
jgi:hypothetical protein